jgi:Tfp pilus assembly protein PilF
LTELTKALAIKPKSATAHNYIGITASQKGWQEAAEKEMLEAIASNPDYADAHFNLAVIYATASPPSKELAKTHYARATSLGAEPDASLEKLLR